MYILDRACTFFDWRTCLFEFVWVWVCFLGPKSLTPILYTKKPRENLEKTSGKKPRFGFPEVFSRFNDWWPSRWTSSKKPRVNLRIIRIRISTYTVRTHCAMSEEESVWSYNCPQDIYSTVHFFDKLPQVSSTNRWDGFEIVHPSSGIARKSTNFVLFQPTPTNCASISIEISEYKIASEAPCRILFSVLRVFWSMGSIYFATTALTCS